MTKLKVQTPNWDAETGTLSRYQGSEYDLEVEAGDDEQQTVSRLRDLCKQHGVDLRVKQTRDILTSKLEGITLNSATDAYIRAVADHLGHPKQINKKRPGYGTLVRYIQNVIASRDNEPPTPPAPSHVEALRDRFEARQSGPTHTEAPVGLIDDRHQPQAAAQHDIWFEDHHRSSVEREYVSASPPPSPSPQRWTHASPEPELRVPQEAAVADAQVHLLKRQLEEVRDLDTDFKRQLAGLDSELDLLREQNRCLREEKEDAKLGRSELKDQIRRTQEENSGLESQLGPMRREVADLRAQHDAVKGRLDGALAREQALERQLSGLRSQLESVQEQREHLESKVRSDGSLVSALDAKNAELTATLEKAQEECIQAKALCGEPSLPAQLALITAERDRLLDTVGERDVGDELAQLRHSEEVQSLRDQLAQLELDTTPLRSRTVELQTTIETLGREKDQAQQTHGRLMSEAGQYKREISELQQRRLLLENEVKRLKDDSSRQDDQAQKLNTANDDLRQANIQMAAQLSRLTAEDSMRCERLGDEHVSSAPPTPTLDEAALEDIVRRATRESMATELHTLQESAEGKISLWLERHCREQHETYAQHLIKEWQQVGEQCRQGQHDTRQALERAVERAGRASKATFADSLSQLEAKFEGLLLAAKDQIADGTRQNHTVYKEFLQAHEESSSIQHDVLCKVREVADAIRRQSTEPNSAAAGFVKRSDLSVGKEELDQLKFLINSLHFTTRVRPSYEPTPSVSHESGDAAEPTADDSTMSDRRRSEQANQHASSTEDGDEMPHDPIYRRSIDRLADSDSISARTSTDPPQDQNHVVKGRSASVSRSEGREAMRKKIRSAFSWW